MGAKFNFKKENVFISLNSALFIKTQTPLDGFVVDLLQTCSVAANHNVSYNHVHKLRHVASPVFCLQWRPKLTRGALLQKCITTSQRCGTLH